MIKLDLSRHKRLDTGWQSSLGKEISQWCQDQGLIIRQNYDWSLRPHGNMLQFRFYQTNETFATLFALRWSQYL